MSDVWLWYHLVEQRRGAWLHWMELKPHIASKSWSSWFAREKTFWRNLELAKANFLLAAEAELGEAMSEFVTEDCTLTDKGQTYLRAVYP